MIVPFCLRWIVLAKRDNGMPVLSLQFLSLGRAFLSTHKTGWCPQALAPGSYVQQGRYIIKKILGQGGMGSVGLAMDTRLADKLVVIKELLAEQGDPAEDVRNFQRKCTP
jgi:serine/threonine protein kinase